MFKKFFSAALIAVLVVGFSSVSFAATFSDVPEGHWAAASVEKLVGEGIIKPDSSKKFNGNSNANFYDVAMMLAGLFNKVAPEKISAENPFSDVPKNNLAYDDVTTMAAIGVMEGYGDGTFKGDKEIKREELALLIANFLQTGGVELEAGLVSFSDLPKDHWAYSAASKVVGAEIMSGYGDGSFKGSNKITKFELALIVSALDDKYFSD